MVVRHCGNVKGDTGAGLKEGGKVHTIKARRGLTTTKPRELDLCRKKDTESISITERGNNIKKLLGKFPVGNKG
jgi:hypothetical protein